MENDFPYEAVGLRMTTSFPYQTILSLYAVNAVEERRFHIYKWVEWGGEGVYK